MHPKVIYNVAMCPSPLETGSPAAPGQGLLSNALVLGGEAGSRAKTWHPFSEQ